MSFLLLSPALVDGAAAEHCPESASEEVVVVAVRCNVQTVETWADLTEADARLLAELTPLGLEAIRWCHDVGPTIIHDADGTLLAVAGKPGANDARLRRAQAAAASGAVGLEITRTLLGVKLDRQTRVTEELLQANAVGRVMRDLAEELADGQDLVFCRSVEARASNAYFGAWSASIVCRFAARDVAAYAAGYRSRIRDTGRALATLVGLGR